MSRFIRNVCGIALASALAGCVAGDGMVGYSVGVGYGGPGYGFDYGYSDYGYGDPYGYGTYYGSLMFGSSWHDGPHRYRRGRYGREYWWNDRWRRPDRDGNGGQWQDDPPDQNAGDRPPPRPNAGFWREREEAAARERAQNNDRGGDRPAFNRPGGNDGGSSDGGAVRAATPRQETPRAAPPPRPGGGQATARARAQRLGEE